MKKNQSGAIEQKPRPVVMNSHQRINVTHWISPFCFYVRPWKIETDFKLMCNDLYEAVRYEKPTTRPLPVGSFVVSEYDHRQYWRAKITSFNEDAQTYTIHCIDTGKPMEDVKQEYVIMMPQRFIAIPPFAIKCSLPKIVAIVEMSVLSTYAQSLMGHGNRLSCTFTSRDGDRNNCLLNTDNFCVRTMLVFNDMVQIVPDDVNLKLMIGQTVLGKIKSFKNLSFFQVKICGSENAFYCTYTHLSQLTDYIAISHDFACAYNDHIVTFRIDSLSEEKWLMVTPLVSLLNHEPPIMPICNMVICNRNLKVRLMHFTSPNIVYVTQIDHEKRYKILSKRMQKFYNSSYSLPYCKLVNICAVKDNNNVWHRAEVVSSYKNFYTVLFIDCGKRDTFHEDRLKLLASSFKNDPAFAVKIHLLLESVGEESLVMDELEKCDKMEASIYINQLYNDHWIGEINRLCNSNVMQMLHQQNMLRRVDVNYVKIKIETAAEAAGNFIDGVKIDARITHIVCPNQFYVQRNVDMESLRVLERNLEAAAGSLRPLKDFTVNTRCVAQYAGDAKWYRAKIIDSDSEVITVFFIDYGYTDSIVDMRMLKELPIYFSDASPLSICCSLPVSPIAEHWSNYAMSFFEMVSIQPRLQFSYIKQLPDVNYVELWNKNKSVSQLFIKQNLAYKYQKIPTKCYITHVNSLCSFYVQEDRDTQKLDNLMAMLQSNTKALDVIMEPREGQLCLARSSSNDLWCRARVISSAKMKVFYIDFGTTNTASDIRSLHCSVIDIAPLVMHCALRIPDDVEKWSKRSEECFRALAQDSRKVFEMNVILLGSPGLVELFTNGANIVHSLEIPGSHSDDIVMGT